MRVIASPGSIKASETRVQGPDRPYHAVSRTLKHPGADVVDEILLASGNPHKLEEVRAVLVPLGLRVTGLDDLATVPVMRSRPSCFSASARHSELVHDMTDIADMLVADMNADGLQDIVVASTTDRTAEQYDTYQEYVEKVEKKLMAHFGVSGSLVRSAYLEPWTRDGLWRTYCPIVILP